MTAQGPEDINECGSCKDVIDPLGVQGKKVSDFNIEVMLCCFILK